MSDYEFMQKMRKWGTDTDNCTSDCPLYSIESNDEIPSFKVPSSKTRRGATFRICHPHKNQDYYLCEAIVAAYNHMYPQTLTKDEDIIRRVEV